MDWGGGVELLSGEQSEEIWRVCRSVTILGIDSGSRGVVWVGPVDRATVCKYYGGPGGTGEVVRSLARRVWGGVGPRQEVRGAVQPKEEGAFVEAGVGRDPVEGGERWCNQKRWVHSLWNVPLLRGLWGASEEDFGGCHSRVGSVAVLPLKWDAFAYRLLPHILQMFVRVFTHHPPL